jgi:hypothetical protein
MLLAIANLIAGMWSGLIRLGWELPLTSISVHHGAIMIGGFMTTLIALEKVIPLKRKLPFAVPVISALSFLINLPEFFNVGLYLLMAGSIGFFLIQAYYLKLYPKDLSIRLMLAGAACLIIGNAMLFQLRLYPAAFPWWTGFLLLIITAERLELSKFLPVTKSNKNLLVLFIMLYLVGLIIPFHGSGKYLSGISMIAIAAWMLRHDVIRIAIKKEGLTRFSATALLTANVWLVIHGCFLFLTPDIINIYDIVVHSFFIGYVFAMIFAHGPIILPGVLGFKYKPYHPILYLWLIVLQGSLIVRIVSDIILNSDIRKLSSVFSGIGILFYFITLIVLVVKSRIKSQGDQK